MDERYKEFLKKVLDYRGIGLIRHRDITTLVAMMQWIDFDSVNDIKNKRLVNVTDMDKSDISKSVRLLISLGIIIETDKGYKLNSDLEIEI